METYPLRLREQTHAWIDHVKEQARQARYDRNPNSPFGRMRCKRKKKK